MPLQAHCGRSVGEGVCISTSDLVVACDVVRPVPRHVYILARDASSTKREGIVALFESCSEMAGCMVMGWRDDISTQRGNRRLLAPSG